MLDLPSSLLTTIHNAKALTVSTSDQSLTQKYLSFKRQQAQKLLSGVNPKAQPAFLYDASFHKRTYSYLNKISTSLRPSPVSSARTAEFPLPAFQAAFQFDSRLTDHEKQEIHQFTQVYFISTSDRKVPAPFTNPKGYYNGVKGDHLAYRYELLELIGRGAYGLVYRCYDHRRKELVAVKVVRKQRPGDRPVSQERLTLEALLGSDSEAAKYIVRLLASFTFREHLCLVFELLHTNLYECLRASTNHRITSMTLLKRTTVQVLKALRLVHRKKFVHADLKPENIGVKKASSLRLKLLDFGSALKIGTSGMNYIQSRFYRAPEIILGINYGPAVDIWSLGCIIVELWTGRPLFPGLSEHEMIERFAFALGLPPSSVLNRATRKRRFFDEKLRLIPCTNKLRPSLGQMLREPELYEFVRRLLDWDDERRLTAEEALRHPWLKQEVRARGSLVSSHRMKPSLNQTVM